MGKVKTKGPVGQAKVKRQNPPPVHSRWKKGQSGNPAGYKPNPVVVALKNLTVDTYREVIELVLTGKVNELEEMAEHPDTPAIQVAVANSFLKALRNGDYEIIERIAERIVGKIPDVVRVTSDNTTTVNAAIAVVTDEELRKRRAKLITDV